MTLLTAIFVRGHRAIFTAATAALGVSASFLADGSGEPGNWLLLVGSGMVMGAEDVCRDIETSARILAHPGKRSLAETRHDALKTHHPRVLAAFLAVGLAAIVVGYILRTT